MSGSRASTSALILRNVASREPQSCTITSFTRLPVVSGPGVSSSGSPVSEAAGDGLGMREAFSGIYHIISQIRSNVARIASLEKAGSVPEKSLFSAREILPAHLMAASDYDVLDERFRNCVNLTSHVERLWTCARWTDGPVYFQAGRYTLFSDIPNDRIMRYDETDGSVSVFRAPCG